MQMIDSNDNAAYNPESASPEPAPSAPLSSAVALDSFTTVSDDAQIDALIEELNLLSGIKPTTRHAYRHGTRHFLKWCLATQRSPIATPQKTLFAYRDELEARVDLAASTKRMYLHAARRVYQRLYESDTTKHQRHDRCNIKFHQ